MFSSADGHHAQRQQSTSSFYIRDILGSETGSYNYPGKCTGYDVPNIPEVPTNYAGMQQTVIPSPSSLPVMAHAASHSFPFTKGIYTDSALDLRNTDTVPLPVYIRSRSPNGSENFNRMKKCRRSRTVFTDLQLMGLEKRFESQKYLSTVDRIELADTLGLSQVQVKTWYQNRRMKWKKKVLDSGSDEKVIKSKGRPKKEPLADGKDRVPTKDANTKVDFCGT